MLCVVCVLCAYVLCFFYTCVYVWSVHVWSVHVCVLAVHISQDTLLLITVETVVDVGG